MHKSKYTILIMLLLLGFLLVSCGKENQEKVVIKVIHGWGSTEKDHVAMRRIYSDFQEKNSDVKLQLVSMPSRAEMIRKVQDMITVGEIPDVIALGGIGRNVIYDFMVENNLALDLIPHLDEDNIFRNNVAPSNLEYWKTKDGKLFTISDVLGLSGGYWYNEKIFHQAGIEEIPQTWDSFEEVCKKIADWAAEEQQEIKPLQVSAEGYLYFTDHILANLKSIYEEMVRQHKIVVDDKQMKDVLDQLRNIYSYSVTNEENYSYRDETDLFNEGKLAMYINGVWGAPMISQDLNVKYALFPAGEETTMSCVSTSMGYLLSNSGDEAKKDASIRFIKYMLSYEVQERILLETEQMPANPNISLEYYRDSMTRFYQAVKTVQAADVKIETPDNLWDSRHKALFEENILSVLAGEMDQDIFLKILK